MVHRVVARGSCVLCVSGAKIISRLHVRGVCRKPRELKTTQKTIIESQITAAVWCVCVCLLCGCGWFILNKPLSQKRTHTNSQIRIVPGACAPWRRLSVVVFPCVGVCGYPVRTECSSACGSQDLQTLFFTRESYSLCKPSAVPLPALSPNTRCALPRFTRSS